LQIDEEFERLYKGASEINSWQNSSHFMYQEF